MPQGGRARQQRIERVAGISCTHHGDLAGPWQRRCRHPRGVRVGIVGDQRQIENSNRRGAEHSRPIHGSTAHRRFGRFVDVRIETARQHFPRRCIGNLLNAEAPLTGRRRKVDDIAWLKRQETGRQNEARTLAPGPGFGQEDACACCRIRLGQDARGIDAGLLDDRGRLTPRIGHGAVVVAGIPSV